MGKRNNNQEVKETIDKLGYVFVSEKFIKKEKYFIYKDLEEYYYCNTYSNLKRYKSSKFGNGNPFTRQNIDLWFKLNGYSFKIIDKEIINMRNFTIQDNEGYLYRCNFSNIQNGLYPNKFYPSNPHTIQNVKLWCKLNEKPFELISGIYKGTHEYLKWKCLNNGCNEEFKMTLNHALQGQNCGYCCPAPKKVGLSNCLATKNPELASEWHLTKNGDLTPFDVTCGSGKEVWWICKECGHEWEACMGNRSNGRGCPECNESKGEKKVKEILSSFEISYDAQYVFDDLIGLGGGLLRYDVPVFWDEDKTKLRLLIEYDGEFHFEKIYEEQNFETQQEHDKRKDDYCIKNNILLIRIPYWEFDNIESILEDILIHNNLDNKFIINNTN